MPSRLLLAAWLVSFSACDSGSDTGPDNPCADDVVDPVDGDGCCTLGANANTDTDCAPVCGNGAREDAESCDDGNAAAGDGCSDTCIVEVTPTSFRATALALRDPHVFAVGIIDVTNDVNTGLTDAITTDASMPPDGKLDFSVVTVFRPLDQTPGTTVPVDIVMADCTAPMAQTTCARPTDGKVIAATAQNGAGPCLAPLPGTTGGYSPAIVSPSGPCFVTSPQTIAIAIGDVTVPLREARSAATYADDPATRLTQGLLSGFVRKADADTTILPENLIVVGGKPLSEVLSDGDQDTGPDGMPGWWFYLNFEAAEVPYQD
jgi:cysteine-rich repeat protein